MDIDEGLSMTSGMSAGRSKKDKREIVFAKSDELLVKFYARLPVEVKQILRRAGELLNMNLEVQS